MPDHHIPGRGDVNVLENPDWKRRRVPGNRGQAI